MADGDVALLTREFSGVLAFEDGVIEHARSPDEVDAMVGQVPGAVLVLPLEHNDLYAGRLALSGRYKGRERFGESYR
jgi:hypothetical protein